MKRTLREIIRMAGTKKDNYYCESCDWEINQLLEKCQGCKDEEWKCKLNPCEVRAKRQANAAKASTMSYLSYNYASNGIHNSCHQDLLSFIQTAVALSVLGKCGSRSQIFTSCFPSKREKQIPWKQNEWLKQALDEKFYPSQKLELYKAEFHVRRQEKGKSLRKFADSPMKLARKAYPDLPATHQNENWFGPKLRNHRACRAWMGVHLPFRNTYHKGFSLFMG